MVTVLSLGVAPIWSVVRYQWKCKQTASLILELAYRGDLSDDFLRLGCSQMQLDEQTAQMLQAQEQQNGMLFAAAQYGRLSVTIVEAKLARNYGLTRMDPYCRFRIGHSVFETPTAHNGAKSPRWNKTTHCFLPDGVDSVFLEIFDERAFSGDERIAWSHITLPLSSIRSGQTIDEWYPLSGKEGDDKEGMVNLVFSYRETQPGYPYPAGQPLVFQTPVMTPAGAVQMPMYYPAPRVAVFQPGVVPMRPQAPGQRQEAGTPEHLPASQQPTYTQEDLKQIKDMFPNVEEGAIISVLEANGCDTSLAINTLLEMASDNEQEAQPSQQQTPPSQGTPAAATTTTTGTTVAPAGGQPTQGLPPPPPYQT